MQVEDEKMHAVLHRKMMEQDPDSIFTFRVRLFRFFEMITGPIRGRVLDIGCGNGYASIYLAKHFPVEEVVALEASLPAVQELIPRNIRHHGVEDVCKPVSGSFEQIPYERYFDFVIAFGALHHSRNLLTSFRQVAKSLKEGGYLIAQEPTMADATTNQDYVYKYEMIEDFFGFKIRNGDRDDHFFRECEYKTAAVFSGFDIVHFGRDLPQGVKPARAGMRMRNVVRKAARFVRGLVGKPDTSVAARPSASDGREVNRSVFVFKKSSTPYIPHVWS
jgi:SAM-dependent methyltransferase